MNNTVINNTRHASPLDAHLGGFFLWLQKETPQKGRRPGDAIAGEGLTKACLFKYKKEINKGMAKKYYAHTLDGKPPSDWQPLEEHLKNVA